MHLITKRLAALAAGAVIGGACSSSDSSQTASPRGVASVTGRLSSDGGNQNVAPAMHHGASGSLSGQIDAVSIATIGPGGQLTVIGQGSVAADGSFAIHDVPPASGPFIVQGSGQAGVLASVIVPGDLAAGDSVTTAPLSAETTLEAKVLASIVASGQSAESVDTIGLMTWISADMAADAQGNGQSAVSFANAAADAQAAWLQVAASGHASVTASVLASAKLAAWNDLTAALNASQTSAAQAQAWGEFMAQASADVAAQAHVDLATQAEATAAAGVLFQAAFADGSAEANDATTLSAVLSAYADWQTQAAATGGSSSASAQLDLAYQGFISAVDSATSIDAVMSAYADLAASVAGQGQNASGSIAATLAAQSNGSVSLDAMQAAISGAADASATLRASIGTALASGERETRVSGVVQSYASFEAAVQASVQAHLGQNAPSWAANFVASAAAEAGGHGSVLLDLDILSVVSSDSGIDIVASLTGSLGFQSGADGLVDGTFTASASAQTAVLATLDANGALHTVASGTIDAHGLVHFDNVTATTASATFIAVLDAEGQIVGAVQLDGVLSGDGGNVSAPPMTAESTAQAQVFMQMVADGVAESQIDGAFLEAHVDAAMAGAMQSDSDVAAVATAIEVAAEVHAHALGTTTTALGQASASATAQLHADLAANGNAAAQAYADFQASVSAAIASTTHADATAQATADAEAAASMSAVLDGMAGANSDLAQTGDANAHLAAAASLEAALAGEFAGTSFGSAHEAQLHATVDAYVQAIAQAQNGAQLDAAGSAFVDAMLGFGGLTTNASGLLGIVVATDLHLNALQQASVVSAVQASFAAASTWQAAIDTATSVSGSLNLNASVSAIAAATSTFESTTNAALDASALASLQGQDGAALHDLVVLLSAGLYGSATTQGGATP